MAVKRDRAANKAVFQVGLNVTLKGSKKMSVEEQDELVTVERVRVIIVEAGVGLVVPPGHKVLIDEELDAVMFSTGSVGYKLHQSNVEFEARE